MLIAPCCEALLTLVLPGPESRCVPLTWESSLCYRATCSVEVLKIMTTTTAVSTCQSGDRAAEIHPVRVAKWVLGPRPAPAET